MSLGVDVPMLLRSFQPKPSTSLSPLLQADAAPVNLMAQSAAPSIAPRTQTTLILRRYIAAAGYVPFAGDLSLLFPVDVRNASVYVKAAAAVDDSNLALAEEILGSAGLWACAAEMHRIHGNKEDFARIARSHVPHLLKSLALKSEQQLQQIAAQGDTGLRERTEDTPADSSAASSAPSRPAFPAPPSPLHSGIRRARFFIPGCCFAFGRMGGQLRASPV